jgi:hypothetical protein
VELVPRIAINLWQRSIGSAPFVLFIALKYECSAATWRALMHRFRGNDDDLAAESTDMAGNGWRDGGRCVRWEARPVCWQ